MVKIVISKRSDGTMQLVGGEIAVNNRRSFIAKHGILERSVVAGQLVNGAEVRWVDSKDGGEKMLATDGLVTTDPELWLSITVADCLPIVIYGSGFVALLHGGWRGLAGGIIEKTVNMIRNRIGEDAQLMAWIGPGIEGHHYPVGEEVAQKFEKVGGAVESDKDVWKLDLKTVARASVLECGITQVEVSPICTYCQSGRYFSARYDQKTPTEVMIVLVNCGYTI